jgi:hypothetical protein
VEPSTTLFRVLRDRTDGGYYPMTVNDDYVHRRDHPNPERRDPRQVLSTPEQVLTGLPLGLATLEVLCSRCGRTLEEGAEIQVYAHRPAEAPRWSLTQCYCPDCGPGVVRRPTLGTTEVLVTAQLAVVSLPAEQRHSLCLASPALSSFSPPTRGSAP